MERAENWTTVFARINCDDDFKEVKQLVLFFLKPNFLQKVMVAHLLMKEAGHAGCFCSAWQKNLPQRVKAQIYCELQIFEMMQHIFLGWKTWSIFFPSFQTQEPLLLCTFLQCYQGMYINREPSWAQEALPSSSWKGIPGWPRDQML